MIEFILWVLGVTCGYAFAQSQHHAFMAISRRHIVLAVDSPA